MNKNALELLNSQHRWPCDFLFKFVVSAAQVVEVSRVFPDVKFQERPSSGGKYVSLTAAIRVNSGEDVLAVYQKAAQIPGLIAL